MQALESVNPKLGKNSCRVFTYCAAAKAIIQTGRDVIGKMACLFPGTSELLQHNVFNTALVSLKGLQKVVARGATLKNLLTLGPEQKLDSGAVTAYEDVLFERHPENFYAETYLYEKLSGPSMQSYSYASTEPYTVRVRCPNQCFIRHLPFAVL